ncbi:hypothetical protein [Deinococcus roseus]|uniref:Carboxypeptidase regulatory-like domain-containing protein n=1 Tax=Deinococcus roseus TaxID=392414 RepID=A0ABQ2CWP1_9DEIO|nr:hypothetical protein [Deinococcus roseus]GGJ28359.1 hypothetical protein GCM10008938_13040 [Deinococcus roseus]
MTHLTPFRTLLTAALMGAVVCLSGQGQAVQVDLPLLLQNQQATQLMVPLPTTLKGQTLSVVLQGWKSEGELQQGPPAGFRINHPKKLSASQNPILPISVQVTGDSDLTRLVLVFDVTGPQGKEQVEVVLQLPPRVRLEVQVPEGVTTLPGYTVQVPIHIHNTGVIPAHIHVELSLALQAVPDFELAPGAARTINLPIPTQATDQTLEIGLLTPTSTLRKKILLKGVKGTDAPYRVKIQMSAGTESGQPVGTQLRAEANLSESVRLSAAVALKGTALQSPSLLGGVGKTTVNYGAGPASGVAGSAGEGLYISGEPLSGLQVGAGWGTRTTSLRLGAKSAGREEQLYWSVAAHSDLAFTSPEFSASLQNSEWSWNSKFTPWQPTQWVSSLGYSGPGEGANARVAYGPAGWDVFLKGNLTLPDSQDRFSSQWNLQGNQWRDFQMTYSNRESDWSWMYRPDQQSEVQASYRIPLQDFTLQFNALVQMKGFALTGAELAGNASYTQGPLQLNLEGAVRSNTSGNLNLSGKYTTLLDAGELSLNGGVRTSWISGEWMVLPFAGINYRDVSGWVGTVSASKTREGINYIARLAYQFELAVPEQVTSWLNGSPAVDPSARTVRLEVQGTGFQPSLAGVALLGCGMIARTDANGKAKLQGFQGPCTITIDRNTLPPRTALPVNTLQTHPGDSLNVQLIPTFELEGKLEYEQTTLPIDPTPRRVRITLAGPDTFFKEVDMPSGDFEFKDLPIGEYTITVGEGRSIRKLLAPNQGPLVLTVPAPALPTLKKTTPPLRLSWQNLTVAAGSMAHLKVTSEGNIQKLVLRAQEWEQTQDCADQTSCETAFVVPSTPEGLLAVQLEVHFANGTVARRSAQLIVSPSP